VGIFCITLVQEIDAQVARRHFRRWEKIMYSSSRRVRFEMPNIDDEAEKIVKRSRNFRFRFITITRTMCLVIRRSKLGFGNPNGVLPVGYVVWLKAQWDLTHLELDIVRIEHTSDSH
jgi:hypothetical protein